MAKLRRVLRVALCHKRKKASDLLLCFRMCSGRVFSIGAFLCCIVFIREEGTKKNIGFFKAGSILCTCSCDMKKRSNPK